MNNTSKLFFNKRQQVKTIPYHLIWKIPVVPINIGHSKFNAYHKVFASVLHTNTSDAYLNEYLSTTNESDFISLLSKSKDENLEAILSKAAMKVNQIPDVKQNIICIAQNFKSCN